MTTVPKNFIYHEATIKKSADRDQYSGCVLHLVDIETGEYYLSAEELQQYLMKTKKFWDVIRVGDLVENVAHSGYRSEGLYIIDEDVDNDCLKIVDLHTDYDDYGTILPHFYAITRFPIGYFDMDYSNREHNVIVNNYFCATGKHGAYWHSGSCLMPLDKETFGIDQLTDEDLLTIDLDHRQIYGIIVEYRNVRYFLTSIYKTTNEFLTYLKEEGFYQFNNLIDSYHGFLSDDSDREKRYVLCDIIEFLRENKIEFNNAYLLDYY